MTTSPGATWASASARLVEIVVLPAPPFGHSAMTTRPRSSPSPAEVVAVEHAAAVGGGVEGALDRRAEVGRRHVGRDHVAGTGAQRDPAGGRSTAAP